MTNRKSPGGPIVCTCNFFRYERLSLGIEATEMRWLPSIIGALLIFITFGDFPKLFFEQFLLNCSRDEHMSFSIFVPAKNHWMGILIALL